MLHRPSTLACLASALLTACDKPNPQPAPPEPESPSQAQTEAPAAARSDVPSPEAKPAPAPAPEPPVALGYTFRDGKVWHLAAARDYYGERLEARLLEGADPATFQALPVAGGGVLAFGRDQSAAYYQERKIEGADPTTFKPLGQGHPLLARDAKNVFFKDTVMCDDADRFELIGDEFAKNGRAIYQTESGQEISQDVHNFRLLHSDDGSEWYADGKKVWCDGVEIVGADAASFKVLGKHYAKDHKRVFFWTEMLPEAELATFEVVGPSRKDDPLGAPTARDAKRNYLGGTPSPRED